jgi:hypothetical protein
LPFFPMLYLTFGLSVNVVYTPIILFGIYSTLIIQDYQFNWL